MLRSVRYSSMPFSVEKPELSIKSFDAVKGIHFDFALVISKTLRNRGGLAQKLIDYD